jgi:hypothetical protein
MHKSGSCGAETGKGDRDQGVVALGREPKGRRSKGLHVNYNKQELQECL